MDNLPMKPDRPIPELAGKTVARAFQEYGWEDDGQVVIEFTDGSRITVRGIWYNDGCAGTEFEYTTPSAPEKEGS